MQTLCWRNSHKYPGEQAVRDNLIHAVSCVAHQDTCCKNGQLKVGIYSASRKNHLMRKKYCLEKLCMR